MHYKQVIVARRDLKMSPGKLAAQVAHASMGAVFQLSLISETSTFASRILQFDLSLHKNVDEWLNNGSFTKVVLGVDSEEELLHLYNDLREASFYPVLIADNGKTEFNNVVTNTCFGLPPYKSSFINTKTGHLKLF